MLMRKLLKFNNFETLEIFPLSHLGQTYLTNLPHVTTRLVAKPSHLPPRCHVASFYFILIFPPHLLVGLACHMTKFCNPRGIHGFSH